MTVMRQKGFTRTDFGRLHPGGSLGARLKPVSRLMHSGEQVPLVDQDTNMHDAVLEMSAKRLGIVGVTGDDGALVGVITDGDLRRHIEQGLDHPASAFMTANPKTIGPDSLVDEALVLFDEHKITTLFVVEGGRPLGVAATSGTRTDHAGRACRSTTSRTAGSSMATATKTSGCRLCWARPHSCPARCS
jgi:arabinose-5-phosphate isomerase